MQCAYVDSLLACKGDFIAFHHILQLQMEGIPQFDPVLGTFSQEMFELIVILAFTVFVTQEDSGLKTKLLNSRRFNHVSGSKDITSSFCGKYVHIIFHFM